MFLSRATAWQYKAEEPYIQEVTSLAQEAGAVTTDDGFHYALLEKQVCCMPETELWFSTSTLRVRYPCARGLRSSFAE